MSSAKLKIGIVGLGVISEIHIEALKQIEEAQITAVCTQDTYKARATADKLGCSSYLNYKDLANDPDVDAVILCTPSGSRLEMTEYIASCKKHIISEKPLEVTPERINRMLEACKENDVFLASVFHKRYHPVYNYIKNLIDSDRLGNVLTTNVLMKWYRPKEYYTDSTWRGTMALDGGGALMNQCIHFVDLVQWFNGGVKSVFAKTDRKVHKNIEAEDTAVGVLEYNNGAFGLIEASTCSYPGFSTLITINGSKGGVICENERIRELKLMKETEEDRQILKDFTCGEHGGDAKTNVKKDISLHKAQLIEIIRAILDGKQPPVEGIEARKAVEIVTSMYRSAKTGKEIFI